MRSVEEISTSDQSNHLVRLQRTATGVLTSQHAVREAHHSEGLCEGRQKEARHREEDANEHRETRAQGSNESARDWS